jgi:hypothetical protein
MIFRLYWFFTSKSKLFRLSSENLERDKFLPISACAMAVVRIRKMTNDIRIRRTYIREYA